MKTEVEKILETLEQEGDPNDSKISYFEENVILRRMYENRLRYVACKEQSKAVGECMENTAFKPLCIHLRFIQAFCTSQERGVEDHKDDCLEEYLHLRSSYRLSRDPKVLRRLQSRIFPMKFPEEYESKIYGYWGAGM